MKQNPIGFFDSGVGGTSIWREVKNLMPNESTVFLADSKNAPYGLRPKDEIVALSIKNTEQLLEHNCKIIIVACNTATTNAINVLRERYPIKFIGIEPAIKPAALKTKTKKVGVLATKGTLTSQLFQNTSKLYASGITVIEQIGQGLVELIEAGNIDSIETKQLLTEYLKPMLDAGIDSLVLGCTHYPYLIPTLNKLLPSHIEIIDSGYAVARQTRTVLEKENLLNIAALQGTHELYSNLNATLLSSFVHDAAAKVAYLDF